MGREVGLSDVAFDDLTDDETGIPSGAKGGTSVSVDLDVGQAPDASGVEAERGAAAARE